MGNIIHSTAVIGPDVILGDNNEIGPYSIIYGPTNIGNNNYFGPHVVVGTPGQDTRNPRYDSSNCKIEIGDDNIIREFTAIQKPCYGEVTKIGNRIYLMQSVHVPHDAHIYDDAVITPMVVLSGIVHILNGANLGVGCSVHQYSVIGHYSIVSMGSAVVKNIKPFSKFIPRNPPSVNYYAIEKYGFGGVKDQIEEYVLNGRLPSDGRLNNIIDEYNNLSLNSKRKEY